MKTTDQGYKTKRRGSSRCWPQKTGQTICLVLSVDKVENAKFLGAGSFIEGVERAISLFKL